MIKKASIIISILVIITLVILLVLQNGERVNFTFLFPSWRLNSINAGVLVIMTFSIGFLVASSIAAIYSLRGFWREFGLIKRDRRRQDFYEILTKARAASAVGNWEEAVGAWQKVSKKDPENLIAKLEIARALRKQGKEKESLELIDQLRRETNDNPEVLLAAIKLNQTLGNKTAALDNALLLLKKQNSAKVLIIARDLAEELSRLPEAIDFHKKLGQTATTNDYAEKLTSLELKLLLAEKELAVDPEKLRDRLQAFILKNTNCAEAFHKLAETELALGNQEEAAKNYAQAGKISNCPGLWKQAINLWLKNNNPAKALATAKTAIKATSKKARLYAELYYIRTQLGLNMLDEAKQSIEAFPKLAEEQAVEVGADLAQQFLALKGLAYTRLGLNKEASDVLTQLSELDFNLGRELNHPQSKSGNKQPDPELSTP